MRPAVTAIVFSVAILAPHALRAQGSGREDLEFKWSKQVSAGGTLVIRNPSGPITVRQASGDRIEVHAVKNVRTRGRAEDVAFDIDETATQIEVCALFGRQASCRDRNNNSGNVRVSVDFTVLVPKSMRLRAATGSGEINIERAGGDVSASTGSGEINIGETNGRVDASTGSGEVHIDGANGPVNVSTGSGSVFVMTARGDVEASTGSGDIDVRIRSLPIERDMKFSTGSGSLRIGLPSAFAGRIDATSGNGSLRSDFEISIMGRLDAHHVRGTIGNGNGPLLRLTTGNGLIELRKN
jgi:DUF4097 and DUF4098 domain-containing protein YvlB